ncbi:WD repeat, SAM and U-box domain-containing protein 1-like [Diorhabda sublineata]|uniref:WD repeat, SAM and U-box domain-containing protein 1-like n=1 Tax=Diorhabda sublineata TaxID=1163346 RepID=UPI0024E056C3|nr:WD repeat, SAM and U-box domain-containing protein 1-like [Diorhabda sublineata]
MAKTFIGNNFKVLQILQGHTSDVTCCDLVTTSTIVTGSSDKTVRIWDWNVGLGYTERSVSPLRAHKYQVTCVKISPQGSLLASASVDGSAVVWNVHSCIKLYAFTQINGDAIRICRFSPNSTLLITAGDNGAVCIWDLVHRSLIKTIFNHQGTTQALTFTPDSYYLVTACSLENIMIWNTEDLLDTTKETPCVPVAKVDSAQDMGVLSMDINKRITFIKNNTLSRQYKLASSGNSNEIKIWTILANFIIKEKTSTTSDISFELFDIYDGHTSTVTCVKYSSNGEYLVSSSMDKLVKVWDNEGNCVASLDGHTRYVNCAAISKDLSIIVSGSNDKSIIIWDTTDNLTLESDLNQPNNYFDRISENDLFQDDNNDNNKVTLIEKIDDLVDGSINSCCFHGKRLLAIGSSDKLIRIFKISVENNVEEHCFSPFEGHTYAVNHLEFSKNGQTLVSCSQDGGTVIWDTNSGEKLKSIPKNVLSIKVCRLCPDNTFLITAGDDEKAVLWNIETMEKITTFEGHSDTISGTCISPDGRIAITVSLDANFRIWSLENYICLYTKKDAHEHGIQNCDMSPNMEPLPNSTDDVQSYLLATCGNDSFVKLWRILVPNENGNPSIDLLNIKLWKSLRGHGGNVICVRYSQVLGEFLCSVATDRQARIWSVHSAYCLYVLDHDSIITSCSFNIDCSLLTTGCLDRTLWLWKLPQHLMFQSTVTDKMKLKSKPIINWTTLDIINWLKNIGLLELISKVKSNSLDGKKIITLSEEQICTELDLDEEVKEKFVKEMRWLKNKEIKMDAATWLDVPDKFLCPITREIMNDPVICSDGYTYEKNAISEWFMSGKYTSPMTNEKLVNSNVISNTKLRTAIYEFLDLNGDTEEEV